MATLAAAGPADSSSFARRLAFGVFGGRFERNNRCCGGQHENAEGRGDERDHGHFDFFGFDLLADVFGRAADHQAGDEDRDDGVEQDAVEARAHAAEDDFAGLNIEERDQAAERSEAIVHAIDGAATGVGGDGGEQSAGGNAEARFFAFHIAAGL